MKALVILLIAGTAAIAAPRTVALGFDHHLHDQKLDINGQQSPPCAACHPLDKAGRLVGRPGHASCFGACHGPAPRPPKRGGLPEVADRGKVCEACHAQAGLLAPFTGKLPAHFPPYLIDRDFNLGFGHKQHAAAPCDSCHAPGTKKTFAPHERCASCHVKTMDKCGGCHPAASGTPQPPELKALHDTVGATFSHSAHAARGAKGKDCASCHAAIRTTDESELPRPTVNDCGLAGCHDGKAAFATTAACTRCHDRAPDERYNVHRPTERFTHGGPHAGAVASQPCGSCHPIAGNEVAVSGHAPCAGCHQKDFGLRKPPICGACHTATEPWRHLVADRGLPDRTEFGASLDHGKHLPRAGGAAAAAPSAGACETCHSLDTASAQLRPPRGHKACSGCHAAASGPAPHLDRCDACHRAGLADARTAARTNAPWSVRVAFDHAPHGKGCKDCHVDLSGADLLTLPTPPKQTCVPCHDGTKAFSLTGTGCTRCHLGAEK